MLEQIIMTVVTTAIGYIVGYKKSQNEVEGGRLENLEKSIKIYQVIIDDMSGKVEELTGHINKLEKRIEELMAENRKLKKHTGL